MPSGDPALHPALHIFDGGQRVEIGEAGTTRYALTIGIEGFVSGGTGGSAHAALNALHAATIAAIYDSTALAAISEEIEEGAMNVAVADRGDDRTIGFSLDLTIYFATQRGDPAIIN